MSTNATTQRSYTPFLNLKYGVNPQQKPAFIATIDADPSSSSSSPSSSSSSSSSSPSSPSSPFVVLNGVPGYINLLDALNAWQLVHELRQATGLVSAASFKHVSPAGVGVALPLSDELQSIYDVGSLALTPASLAYLRARQTDPKCSFGDFAALSDEVDEETAQFLKREVSDGIIAPHFTDKALEILKTKKNGTYIILQASREFVPPAVELREVYGVCFAQGRNVAAFTRASFSDIKTSNRELSESAIIDLLIASITAKYTQSNSVVYAKDGQTIGVGAGQQSRVDCVKLAGNKAAIWWMRQMPQIKALPFLPDVKRVERVNARIAYIEDEGDDARISAEWQATLEGGEKGTSLLSAADKQAWLKQLKGVALCSDAFFPFADNIHQSARRGVQYIAQAGGSVQDQAVIEAANQYQMVMAFTGIRLFHH